VLPGAARQSTASPDKPVADDDASRAADAGGANGAKRQKISLKIKSAAGTRELSRSPVPETVDEERDAQPVASAEASIPGALSKDIRGALAIVIAQCVAGPFGSLNADLRMAVNLPPPLNGVMTLSLPPKFETTEDNTLGYKLNQSSLTWASLVVCIMHDLSHR
jgi:hypothetical protein